jgi:hypothetical protein
MHVDTVGFCALYVIEAEKSLTNSKETNIERDKGGRNEWLASFHSYLKQGPKNKLQQACQQIQLLITDSLGLRRVPTGT